MSVGHGTELKNRRAKVNNVVQHHQLQQRISRINGYLAAAAVDGGGVDGGVEDLELAVPDRLVAQWPLRDQIPGLGSGDRIHPGKARKRG